MGGTPPHSRCHLHQHPTHHCCKKVTGAPDTQHKTHRNQSAAHPLPTSHRCTWSKADKTHHNPACPRRRSTARRRTWGTACRSHHSQCPSHRRSARHRSMLRTTRTSHRSRRRSRHHYGGRLSMSGILRCTPHRSLCRPHFRPAFRCGIQGTRHRRSPHNHCPTHLHS